MKSLVKNIFNHKNHLFLISYLIIALVCSQQLCMAQACETPIPQPDIQVVYKLINVDKIKLENIAIPNNSGNLSNKPYMDISKITNRNSPQWELLSSLDCVDSDNLLSVNNNTGFINVDGYLGVAMGTYFDGKELGTKYRLTLDTGIILKVIKVELKADKDTCELGMRSYANDIIEFVVDSNAKFMQDNIGENGLIFNGNFNNCDKFKGNIIKIEKVIESEE